jgi:hypothetical protein
VTLWRHLQIGNAVPTCPRIHFVSGLARAVDSDNILIAYGINDCLSRIVEIPMSEIGRLLFGPVDDSQTTGNKS